MRISILAIVLTLMPVLIFGQQKTGLNYYLPNIEYDPSIPTPSSWLGYEVGDWHCTHDQLLGYMYALDAASERIKLEEYGRSYENRPLICLSISTPANLAKSETIKASRQLLCDPDKSSKIDVTSVPAVALMGYSIHGNETSGSNAALLVAYYLAAGRSQEIDKLLENSIILLDPCFNPDGMQRFSAWVNSHKSLQNSSDPFSDEYNEPWPRGRTNHYGFDLNRDWLVTQQPESQGRLRIYHEWMPNILTDHHEMGSNSTFFFQPGVSSRVNPITPLKNQELTARITGFTAGLLSSKNILYYSGENFDDFYYGKGSTYPDAQGAMGILFEQASSRGTAQETENGLLTFQYSIRNQVLASMGTLKALGEMRIEMNEYLRLFFKSALEEARSSPVKGYVFKDGDVPARIFLGLLGSHGIEVRSLKSDVVANGETYTARNAFFVPCLQAQYRLVRAVFERTTSFRDSIFYDISAWTLPDAFGLEWSELNSQNYHANDFEEGVAIVSLNPPSIFNNANSYAYAIPPTGYEMPKMLAKLLKKNLRVRVALEKFTSNGQRFPAGTILVAADRQKINGAEFLDVINEVATSGSGITEIENGLTEAGPDFGSSQFPVIRQPKIIMMTGEGVNVADAGEIWHQLDTRYEMPITMVDVSRFGSINLSKYNVLILPNGNYGSLSSEKVKQFAADGGTVIATGKALNWLKNTGIAGIDFRISKVLGTTKRSYDDLENDRSALAMPGAIFEAELDLTHPICFGYSRTKIPIFLGDTLFVNPGKNPYSTPIVMTERPLLAGYVHPKELPLASKAAVAIVYGVGRGKVICFPGNLNFRSFWYGTNRIFANAIFFGHLISTESTEKK